MKKIVSLILALLTTFIFFGCATTTPEETEYSKGKYNIAYLSFFVNNEHMSNYFDDYISKDFSSAAYGGGNITYMMIDDWEFGKNDTIILYLKDGRTLQTSIDNVVLMYDPEFE